MLTEVYLANNVAQACWTHAHTTEKEEVMGLLLGKIVPINTEEEDEVAVHFTAFKVIKRLTKQKDRVEIAPEQLMTGMEYAESLGGGERVLGWYHSHPHITVWPSHVDLRTQASYQNMDQHFVGLIFSVFNHDPNTGVDTREVTAFQSEVGEDGSCSRREVALHIDNSRMKEAQGLAVVREMARIPEILAEEEMEEEEKASRGVGWMTKVHNEAVLTSHLAEINRVVAGPMLDMIEMRIMQEELEVERLEKEKQRLLEVIRLREEADKPSTSKM